MFAATTAHAGTTYNAKCTNSACGYQDNISFHGGMLMAMVTGFCVPEQKIVYVQWKREGKGPEPMLVWNAATGETTRLFACPDCGKPFLPIPSGESMKHCPKCNQPTLQLTIGMMFD